MAAHRYWRLDLPPNNISNGTLLSNLELRASIGGADLAAGAVKTSNINVANLAPFFDGNNGTEYYALSSSNWANALYIVFDFEGTPRDIQEVLYRTGSNAALAPDRIRLWYSDDLTQAWKRTSLDTSAYAGATINTNYTFNGFTELGDLAYTSGIDPVRILTSPVAAVSYKTVSPPIFVRDIYDAGFGRIYGTVKEKVLPSNVPLRRRVRLFHELTGRFIRETWSDEATGEYEFRGIDPSQKYTVVTYDYTNNYRAVIADNLTPEVYTP